MTTFFIVVGWLIALGSWLFVSQATSGVAGICFACFMVIAARVAQADAHQKELLLALATRDAVAPPTTLKEQEAVRRDSITSTMTIEEKAAAAGVSSR